MNSVEVGIIGDGGQSREVREYLRESNIEPSFLAVDREYVDGTPGRIDILSPSDYQELTPVVAAIGAPEIRRKMVEEWRGGEFFTVISNQSYVGDTVRIGEGSIISPRAVLTASIEVGRHVIVNVGATVSHDSEIGDYATIGPGAHIAGGVKLGRGVFIGIGASVNNGVEIADGCVVGAGAVVISDILEPNSVVVGTPARLLRINEGWLSEV